MPNVYSFRCQADEAEIQLYDVIDPWWGISAKQIADDVKAAKDVKTLRIRINSPGGSIVEGTAIYNVLKRFTGKKIVTVDGIAASMASVVAMAGDEIEMGEGAYLMIHDPGGFAGGNADDHRDWADLLDKMKDQLVGIYAGRTGIAEAELRQMMSDETWLTASEAVAKKFADRTVKGAAAAAAHFDMSRFGKLPERFRNQIEPVKENHTMADTNTAPPAPATFAELKAICNGDQAFICSQLEASATADQAAKNWSAEQLRRAEAKAADLEAKLAAAKDEAEKAKAEKPGVKALGSGKAKGGTDAGDPVAEFDALVRAKMSGGMARQDACVAAAIDNPEAHAAYLMATNAGSKKAQRLIGEKYNI